MREKRTCPWQKATSKLVETNPLSLDAIDYRILTRLQQNGRISNTELAEAVSLSPSACTRRVHILQDAGLIAGYVALLDNSKLGFTLTVIVQVTLSAQTEEMLSAFENAIREIPEVLMCYMISGEADYVVHIAVPDIQRYDEVYRGHLSTLPGVARLQSSIAMRTVVNRTSIDLASRGNV